MRDNLCRVASFKLKFVIYTFNLVNSFGDVLSARQMTLTEFHLANTKLTWEGAYVRYAPTVLRSKMYELKKYKTK